MPCSWQLRGLQIRGHEWAAPPYTPAEEPRLLLYSLMASLLPMPGPWQELPAQPRRSRKLLPPSSPQLPRKRLKLQTPPCQLKVQSFAACTGPLESPGPLVDWEALCVHDGLAGEADVIVLVDLTTGTCLAAMQQVAVLGGCRAFLQQCIL